MEPITITIPGLKQIFSHFFPPESTDDVIIFPYSSGSQKFSRTVDSTKITQGKASLNDINDVLSIFELVYSRTASPIRFVMNLFLSYVIPYMLFWNSYWFDYRLSETMRYGTLVFFSIMTNFSLYKRMRETGRRKVHLQRMIEMIRPAYAKRGLVWGFSETFFCCWLELKKEGEVHSEDNRESLISQDRIFDEFKDGENILICAGKTLEGPDSSPRVQFRYVILMIICGYYTMQWIHTFSYFYWYLSIHDNRFPYWY